LRAHSSTSSTLRTSSGFLRTPGFFRMEAKDWVGGGGGGVSD
jgi:hypothetical protein